MGEIRFDGRVAIVTGAGGGLGRTYALDLARRGAAVVVNDLGGSADGHGHSRSMADAVVEEIKAAGGRAITSYDSVATSEGGARIVAAALDAFQRLDILVNNAGILRTARMVSLPDADIDALIDVHLKGAFHVTRPAMRAMTQRGYGRIVFTSSGSGVYGCGEQAAYAAAKMGLIGLLNVVAIEGKRDGILANAIMPVALVTRMAGVGGNATPEQIAFYEQLFAPFGNAVTNEYVTPLVTYLASETCLGTKGLYSASGGRFSRVFTGTTRGWYGPREAPATAEDIADNIAVIEDRIGYAEITDLFDEAANIAKAIKGGTLRMSLETQERNARAALQGIADGHIDTALLSEDFIFSSSLVSDLGAEAFAAGVAQTGQVCASPMRMDVHEIVAAPGKLMATTESHAALITGEQYNNHYSWFFRFDDRNRITLMREYCDTKLAQEVLWPAFAKIGGFGNTK